MVQEVGSKAQLEEGLEKVATEIEVKEYEARSRYNPNVSPPPKIAEDMLALMASSGKVPKRDK